MGSSVWTSSIKSSRRFYEANNSLEAGMFWWLYKNPNRVQDPSKSWPIVLGCKDNPVETSYSFVEDEMALVNTDEKVALDLTVLLMKDLNRNKILQKSLFYIVAETRMH
ncbi:hypothetical protein GIB67_020068 [Kingdonia uniflora]|uniref:Uncharacterized protein n=1 Tax=Kingdonia uniflora TaxID=39325 RepID=A0A7J7L287_9MAGN|nr:hypothetical protein GIB67_020068 [Kingdonia uniflora]